METKIPIVKLEHYVPQFYLKQFVIKPKKHSIFCFDKSKLKSFNVSIKNVANETYFYDQPGENEQTKEKTLAVMESSFKNILEKILATEDLTSLSAEDKESVAIFVTTQELRTREYRETLKDMWKQTKDTLIKVSGGKISQEFEKRYRIEDWGPEQNAKSLQLDMLKNIPKYADILLHMAWFLLLNRTPVPFLSSDHPINRYNPIDVRPRGNLGLLSEGIQIHFPLTPKLTLSFCDPSSYQLPLVTREIKDVQNIIFTNSLQITHSTRYIFSNVSDFSLAREILRDNPSLGDIHRKRMSIK